jgi:hypothetical protein
VYLCADENLAAELARWLGDGAFALGRFALGPYLPTSADRALAQTIRKALD